MKKFVSLIAVLVAFASSLSISTEARTTSTAFTYTDNVPVYAMFDDWLPRVLLSPTIMNHTCAAGNVYGSYGKNQTSFTVQLSLRSDMSSPAYVYGSSSSGDSPAPITVRGLSLNTTYYFRAKATNGSTRQDWTKIQSFKTGSDTTYPC